MERPTTQGRRQRSQKQSGLVWLVFDLHTMNKGGIGLKETSLLYEAFQASQKALFTI